MSETKEKYKIPEATQTGSKFTIRNKGFKSINSTSYGDFIFTVTVQTPKRLSKEPLSSKLMTRRTSAALAIE